MSSLQKFHRRTQSGSAAIAGIEWPAAAIGHGDEINGYWIGDVSTNKLIIAPYAMDTNKALPTTGGGQIPYGSSGTSRGATSNTNGLANTNTLYAFGSAAHPAAYYAKTTSQGGYNTWYLPARDELMVIASNRAAQPFKTMFPFSTDPARSYYQSSTEASATQAVLVQVIGNYYFSDGKNYNRSVIPVRRTTV